VNPIQTFFRWANDVCSLYPLTEEDNTPKALLPIANTPLVYFPIEWCARAGFSGTVCQRRKITEDVTVVCHTEALDEISAYTSSLILNITIKVIAKSSIADNLASAEVLALFKDTITVLSQAFCGLIRARRSCFSVRFIYNSSCTRIPRLPRCP